VRFGEAAVQMGLISDNDVRFALAKQYDFPHLVRDTEAKGSSRPTSWWRRSRRSIRAPRSCARCAPSS
jgi:hypothetical protein